MEYLALIIGIAALVLSLYVNGNFEKNLKKNLDSHRYLMYVGLNDKDTGEQKISTDEAVELLNNICAKYLRGFNIRKSVGYWTDDDGNPVSENSLVISYNFIEEKNIHIMADEVIQTLNQDSVFLEDYLIKTEFYYGSNK